MPCDTRLKAGQSIKARAEEVRAAVVRIATALATGRVKPKIGPTGGIAFEGLSEADRDGVTDNCLYRRLLATGSATAKAAIARAEQLAGRSVSKEAVAHGHHAHTDGNGNLHWHTHKG